MKVRKAVIPAAGLGTRMLPVTKTVPKEMLPLVDTPALHYLVAEAVASGIEDILIITNRTKTAMEDYFDYSPEIEASLKASGKLKELDMVRNPADMANIFFIRQKETKGLGHAIGRAREFVGDEPFAVMLGDDIIMAEKPVLKQMIEASEKYNAASIGTQLVSDEMITKYSSLKVSPLEGRIMKLTDMNEKPTLEEKFSNYAILGRYILTPAVFDLIDRTPPGRGGEIQLTDALQQLCRIEDMIAVDFEGKRYDTGNVRGYLEAVIDFALVHEEAGPWLREFIKEKAKAL